MRRIFATILSAVFIPCSAAATEDEHAKTRDICEGRRPAIACDRAGQVYIAFVGQNKTGTDSEIFVIKSSDGGKNWTKPVNISNTPANSETPAIAVEKSGAVDIVWTDSISGSDVPDIYFARSADGKTWSSPTDISNTPGGSFEPAIALGPDDKLQVVWCDTNKGEVQKDVFYTWSTDHGVKWGRDELQPATDISNTRGASTEPSISVSADGTPHVTWIDTAAGAKVPGVFYATLKSDKWTKPVEVSKGQRKPAHPDLACGANGAVYLTWSDSARSESDDEANNEIWYAKTNGGTHFEKAINISNTKGGSSEPSEAASGSHLAIVWTDTTKSEARPDVWGRTSLDGGKSFKDAVDLGETPGISKAPDVAILDDTLYVTWQETQGLANILKFQSRSFK